MRDIDIIELDYHIQPPIISLINIDKKELERIKDSLIRITKAIKFIQQTDYYPVITFLASEKQLQIIRKYISVYYPGNEDPILYPIEDDYDIPICVLKCARRLAEILQETFSEDFPQIREYFDNLEEIIGFFEIILNLISMNPLPNYLIEQIIDNIINQFSQNECFHCGLWFDNRDFHIEFNDFFNLNNYKNEKRNITWLIKFLISWISFLKEILKYIIRIHPERVPIFEESDGISSPIDIGIFIDLHYKYGCFVPYYVWESYEKKGLLNQVKYRFGIPKNINLAKVSSIFIYPFLIEQRYETLSEEFKNFFLDTTLIHEHAHASFRHSYYPDSNDKKLRFDEPTQKKLDHQRHKILHVNEGMAVYHEYWYADSNIHTYGSKIKEKMKLEIEKYANSPKSLKDWPYKYMNEIKEIVEVHGSSKLVLLIKKWKSDPNNVIDFIDRLIWS